MSELWDAYLRYGKYGMGAVASNSVLKVEEDDSDLTKALKTGGQTVFDAMFRFTQGASKSIEGVVDYGLGIGAGISGFFGDEEKQSMLEKAVRYDWTYENVAAGNQWNDHSLLRGNTVGEFTGNVIEGVGGMVPAVVSNAVLPGSGIFVMSAGAAGNATEEALNNGAAIGPALAYGTLRGSIEALTEKLGGFNFGGGTVAGKLTAGTTLGKATSKGIGKLAESFVAEGTEEVISDMLDPLAKKATGVDTRSLDEQYAEVQEGLGETFLTGGAVGTIMSGGQNFVRNSANRERGGARASRADDYISYVSDISANLKGTDADVRYDRAIHDSFIGIEGELMQMSENSRKNYLKSLEKTPFKMAFNETGKYVGAKANNINPGAISNNLRNLSANLKYKAVSADVELSEDAIKGKKLIEDIFGKNSASVVISDDMDANTRMTVDISTGVIYINNNMEFDEKFSVAVAAIHEIVHTTEGTEEYEELANLAFAVFSMDEFQNTYKNVDFSEIDIDNLTKAQAEYVLSTEKVADLVGHLLSSPSALAKLRARNKGVFEKLKAIFHFAHDSSTSKEGKKTLKKVLDSFDKALEASHGGVLLSDLSDDEEKENTEQGHGVDEERDSKASKEKDQSFIKDKYFESQIDKWKSLSHGSYVKVGELHSSHPLCLVGMPSGVLRYDVSKINKNMSKHSSYLTIGLLKEIPNIIEHPIAITEFTEENTVNVFGNVFVNNHPMMLGVTISKDRAGNDISKIRTYNLRRDVEKIITDENILYLNEDKKRTQEWFQACGKQVPLGGNKFGFIHSISQNLKNVNIDERNSKKATGKGVTWDDLNTDSHVLPEDNSDIRVHPPKPKNKAEAKEVSEKKEVKKAKRPLKITKALTNEEGINIISYIMEDHFKCITADTKMAYIPKEARKDIIDRLTHIADTNDMESYVGKVYDIAELICNEAVIREQYDISDRVDVEEARRTVDILNSYKGKINLEAILEDIKTVYDTRASHLIRTWGAKKRRGVSTDVIKEELSEYGIRISAINEADIFTELVTKYDMANSIINDAEKSITTKVKDLFAKDADGKARLIENVADDIHTLFNKNIEREYFKTYSKVLSVCRKFNDLKKGTYVNATEIEDAALRNVYDNIKTLRGGLLSVKSVTETFKHLTVWYSDKNESLEGRIDSETQELIREIAFRRDDPINVVELKNILKVLQRVYATLENYTKIYRDGRYHDISDIVESNMKTAERAKNNDNTITKFYRNKFLKSIGDPQYVCELLDGYRQGFATAILKELREGEIKYSKTKIDILTELDKFFKNKENKKYINTLSKRTINIDGKSVPMDIAISVYMTNKRCHAQKGLQMNGFEYKGKKGNIDKLEGLTVGDISGIEANFTEKDKQFISIVESVYKKCRDYKYDTDMVRLGFSNIVTDYYYPIFRVHATSIESSEMYFAADSVNTAYFNKNTVQGAKQRLVVKSVLDTMTTHIEGIARYVGYAIAVDNFNKLWNFNTVENKNNPVTIKNKLDAFWGEGSKYLVDLVNDVQGKRLEQQPGADIINWLRSSYATYQLGANPKVWFTQLSSYLAAFNKLSKSSMLKAFTIDGTDVDEYCALAEIRNRDMQIAKAQSVSDKVGKIGNIMMKPIGAVDRMVVKKLFAACQIEVNKRYGLALGSEENKIRAGELLTEIIFETQQNSFASERSAVMRRSGEIIKSFTMFSADAMKLWSRWFGAIGKHHTIRRELYLAKQNGKNTTELENELKEAKKEVAKTTTSVVTVAMFMAFVSMAFRHLYNKDDEENDAVTFAKDFGANLIGMFPFIRDAVSYFSEGYDVGTFATDSFNNVLSSVKSLAVLIGDAISGKYVSKQEIAKVLKSLFFTVGQVSGIPTRNVYNFTAGMINRFAEGSLGYMITDVIYGKSYSSDLSKAIEEGDEVKIHTILSLASAGEGSKYSSETMQVISNLYRNGYNCLPRTISEKVIVAGVEYELTAEQYKSITQEYGRANGVINDIVVTSGFDSLSAESQSKAIKFVNDYYFAAATEKGLGISYKSDSSYYKKLVYGKLIDIKVLAMAVAQVNEIKKSAGEGDNIRQKIRDYIQSLPLSAEQKYLLFNYFGYTSEVDKEKMVSFIKSNSKLSAENKEYLLKRYK